MNIKINKAYKKALTVVLTSALTYLEPINLGKSSGLFMDTISTNQSLFQAAPKTIPLLSKIYLARE